MKIYQQRKEEKNRNIKRITEEEWEQHFTAFLHGRKEKEGKTLEVRTGTRDDIMIHRHDPSFSDPVEAKRLILRVCGNGNF